jgi:hypothetical protein
MLFKGYTHADYVKDAASTDVMVFFVTYLHTSDGEKVVISKSRVSFSYNTNTKTYFLELPTLLSYPDDRAYKIDVFANIVGNENAAILIKSFELTSSQKFGFSYYYAFAFESEIDIGTLSPTIRSYPSGLLFTDKYGILIPESRFSETMLSLPNINNSIRTPNNIFVSAVHLPMVYRNNYIAGDRKVVGFSANNLSIDASNFGLYPVFVFTEGGIYAMELGTDGATLVQRIVPLSGDVCINRDSITNIGGATLFASKDGLRVLQGQRSEKITSPLELYGGNPLKDATLKSGAKALDAILTKYGLSGYVDSVDFQTFLAGAKCYFHYKENDVVITNESYPYSYVYSLNTKMYHKVFERYYHVFNDYPNAYGVDSTKIAYYNLGEEVAVANGRQNVLLQTNAFKLTTDGFEILRRIFTRFGWSAAPVGSKIGIYLFVSNDTRKWAWVDACEITQANAPNGAQNFAPLRCPASVKYGMLVIAGDMDAVNDYITHISVEYEQRYNSKLR